MTAQETITAGVAVKISRFPKYEFSPLGVVISHTRKAPFIMKPIRMGEYRGLQLLKADGSREKAYLHRLIAEAFHGPCPNDMVCRHIDGDRRNNAASNLAWGSQSENNLDKRRHGTSPDGERNPMAKLTAEVVVKMREERASIGKSFAALAADHGVSTMTAHRAVTGKAWVSE